MKKQQSKLSRRAFLGTAAAAVAAPAIVRGQNLNDKLNIAMIGSGGRGKANLNGVKSQNIVALCDVNQLAIDELKPTYPNAKTFTDFRKVYDHANDFDAVVVSTCEHTHAFATLPALQLGKHVYCEKPLTHSVWEARVIREAAAKPNVATQMGTQIHAGDNYRRVVEHIQAGVIGSVSECHVWNSRAWGWHATEEDCEKNRDIVCVANRPSDVDEVPATLDWDLWIGPAPERPFNDVYVPGPKWYRWWDFGNGTMSDLGSHWIDLPFWALDLDYPQTIEPGGPPAHPELAPASMQATYTYAAKGDRGPLTLTWYQGANRPTYWTEKIIPPWNGGILFVGDKGMLLADYGSFILLPEDDFKDYEAPEQTIPKSLGHYNEWIHACKTGAPTTCNFEYAGWLTEANHLGNVAYRAGKKLEWDPATMKATNAPEADPFIRREYRKGWSLA